MLSQSWRQAATAVGFNLVPIAGVFLWHWNPLSLVFLYWLENVAMGIRTLVSALTAAWSKGLGPLLGIVPRSAFFAVHFGLFCLIHGAFVMSVFSDSAADRSRVGFGAIADTAIDLVRNQHNFLIGVASIAIWQTLEFAAFILSGEPKGANPVRILEAPYRRILMLHGAILLSGVAVSPQHWPVGGVVVLAVLRSAFDIAWTVHSQTATNKDTRQ